jgi:hypothetical protein
VFTALRRQFRDDHRVRHAAAGGGRGGFSSAIAGRRDGLGWWLNLLGTLMRDFHMSEQQALNYPLSRAFALKNFNIESNSSARVIYETPGYIGQEIERLKTN